MKSYYKLHSSINSWNKKELEGYAKWRATSHSSNSIKSNFLFTKNDRQVCHV